MRHTELRPPSQMSRSRLDGNASPLHCVQMITPSSVPRASTRGAIARLLAVVLVASVLAACSTPNRSESSTNVAIVRRYFDEWANQGNVKAAEELIATDMILKNPPLVVEGLETYKRSMAGFHTAFPDLHFTVEDLIAQGPKVLVRWSLTGTQQGPFQGRPASGKRVGITGMSLFRLEAGKIREIWVNMDRAALAEQLGPLPSGSAPAGK